MKTVLQQLKQYKRDAWTCIGLTTLEVVMEILLPFVTAHIIDDGLQAANLGAVYRYGALMIVMAFVSLACGAFAGKAAAAASSGLAANLREAIYAKIQPFSFSNIDKFSVPGLVTRMTTDITNVQNAFMRKYAAAAVPAIYSGALRGGTAVHAQRRNRGPDQRPGAAAAYAAGVSVLQKVGHHPRE